MIIILCVHREVGSAETPYFVNALGTSELVVGIIFWYMNGFN